jgi:hypothetical protein
MVSRGNGHREQDDPFVSFYAGLFNFLKMISVFELIRWLTRKLTRDRIRLSRRFVEVWVVGHSILSLISVFVVYYFGGLAWLTNALMVYGLLRTFEILVYQINVFLFDEYRALRKGKPYRIVGYRRIIILLAHNFFEIIFWFTVIYLNLIGLFRIEQEVGNNILQALYISFVTMTTFGLPNFNVTDSMSISMVSIQSFAGLVMTLISLARFISLLPAVESQSERPHGPDRRE